MAGMVLIAESDWRAVLDLLKQAEIVIRPEPGKIVYRAARVAWAEQFDQLMRKFDHAKPGT